VRPHHVFRWEHGQTQGNQWIHTHLGAALGAVGAADVLDMAAAVLVAAAVAALESLRR
jgi:hypothetical protein